MVVGGCKVQLRRGDWEKVSREVMYAGGSYFLVVYPTVAEGLTRLSPSTLTTGPPVHEPSCDKLNKGEIQNIRVPMVEASWRRLAMWDGPGCNSCRTAGVQRDRALQVRGTKPLQESASCVQCPGKRPKDPQP